MCSVPSSRETPRLIELCESLARRPNGSAMLDHSPSGLRRASITALFGAYHAAYCHQPSVVAYDTSACPNDTVDGLPPYWSTKYFATPMRPEFASVIVTASPLRRRPTEPTLRGPATSVAPSDSTRRALRSRRSTCRRSSRCEAGRHG